MQLIVTSRVPITTQPGEQLVPAIIRRSGLRFFLLASLLVGFATRARANTVVLLEEPFSYDGAFAGTGHSAVYLTRVCAESPVRLRRCEPGELGTVISRYARIGGYDWIAIPLVPYLYAVEKPEDVPLYADANLVAFLRDQYRRKHLEEIAPDASNGETPKGDWNQLIGSSYDRTNYGFQIETTAEQDDALIAWLNSQPNRTSYKVLANNCANFVADILNFYYPHSETRAAIGDLFVSTPKHGAKSLVRYSRHHPELQFTHFVIPQVPGTMKRSKPIHGILESVFRAKKYVAALALIHPLVAAGVASAYLAGDRFNPARNAEVFSLTGEPVAPLTKDERHAFLNNLKTQAANDKEHEASRDEAAWRKFEVKARPELNAAGELMLQGNYDHEMVNLGVARSDLGDGTAPLELERGMMISRLKQTLAHSRAPRISGIELREDWQLLGKLDETKQAKIPAAQGAGHSSQSKSVDLDSN